jgi:hypothetical protein
MYPASFFVRIFEEVLNRKHEGLAKLAASRALHLPSGHAMNTSMWACMVKPAFFRDD